LQRTSNDLLGVGFVWSQPSAAGQPVYHQNEYIAEAFYTLQFSPTLRLQPDFQFVADPAFNRDHDYAMVFQLQLILAW
jgi:carbohydrate-selective porin OprB